MYCGISDTAEQRDVVVVGAGPAGCVAALAMASGGADVLLLDSGDRSDRRLAGEWIHPAGMRILDRLGVQLPLDSAIGHGFVVFPNDGSAPIPLSYADGIRARVCAHATLVGALRVAARAHPNIEYVDAGRVRRIDGHAVFYDRSQQAQGSLIIGADGRSSTLRRALGKDMGSTSLSRMAGLLLREVELPYENFGHVLLGGPGPVLMYRISPTQVRVCIDVPAHMHQPMSCEWLGQYEHVFPTSLRPAIGAALSRGSVQWAANRAAPRIHYGHSGYALVGDATGYCHPVTAVGLTLAFADAECLARTRSVAAYARERSTRTRTADMLGTALYDILSDEGVAAQQIRRSMYHMWRRSPTQCARTMRLLGADEHTRRAIWHPFVAVMAGALATTVRTLRHDGRRSLLVMAGCLTWLRWLVAATVHRPSAGIHVPRSAR